MKVIDLEKHRVTRIERVDQRSHVLGSEIVLAVVSGAGQLTTQGQNYVHYGPQGQQTNNPDQWSDEVLWVVLGQETDTILRDAKDTAEAKTSEAGRLTNKLYDVEKRLKEAESKQGKLEEDLRMSREANERLRADLTTCREKTRKMEMDLGRERLKFGKIVETIGSDKVNEILKDMK